MRLLVEGHDDGFRPVLRCLPYVPQIVKDGVEPLEYKPPLRLSIFMSSATIGSPPRAFQWCSARTACPVLSALGTEMSCREPMLVECCITFSMMAGLSMGDLAI